MYTCIINIIYKIYQLKIAYISIKYNIDIENESIKTLMSKEMCYVSFISFWFTLAHYQTKFQGQSLIWADLL